MRPNALSILAPIALLMTAFQSHAEDSRWYVSPSLSYIVPDDDLHADDGFGGGLAVGRTIDDNWNLELALRGNGLDADAGAGDWNQWSVGVDGLYFLNRDPAFAPYLVVGAGYLRSDGPTEDTDGAMANLGLGFQRQLSGEAILRGDIRYRWYGNDLTAQGDSDLGDWVISMAIDIPFGAKAAAMPAKPAAAEPMPAAVPVRPEPAPAPAPAPAPSPAPVPVQPVAEPAKPIPADHDNDGVPDALDQCPDTPAGARVDDKGCELDSDQDGVVDRLDQCPDTPAGAKVDAKGCELDSDQDGVVDRLDQCPDTPAGAKVDDKGCELDSDGDGVVDRLDLCPGTTLGTPVDGRGCKLPPQIEALKTEAAKQVVKAHNGDVVLLLRDVNFEFDSAKLRPDAIVILDEVITALKYRSEILMLEIAGHTCSIGTEKYNLGLSERRSQSVYDYFVAKGLTPKRFQAEGYGESRPAFSNATREGRAKNRRVELRILKD